MVIYGLSLVGFGLLISSLCSTQQQAFIGVFVRRIAGIIKTNTPINACCCVEHSDEINKPNPTSEIYGLSLVGFGLLISSLCSTQQQAFIGVFVFMMPGRIAGIIKTNTPINACCCVEHSDEINKPNPTSDRHVSPVENMPQWLQDLTWINPIRHFTDITKQIYLKESPDSHPSNKFAW
jgi:ABC-type transport system involved in multi-copper enzyme maturation permease subunit